MSEMNMRSFFIAVLLIFLAAGTALAQTADQKDGQGKDRHYLYEWTDEQGGVHITDDLGDVPLKYRQKVKKRSAQPSQQEPPQGQEVQGGTAPAPEPEQENEDEAKKAEWQGRMQEWKMKLANAEKRYSDLDAKRVNLRGGWGVLANAPPEVGMEYERITEEMKNVQKEIDQARHMVNVVIPEEARKAGIPPGWLRE